MILNNLKYRALTLRKNYQLPYQLVYYITLLNCDSDIRLIEFLKTNCEHLLRVKGYYKKYPMIEQVSNEDITKAYESFVASLK